MKSKVLALSLLTLFCLPFVLTMTGCATEEEASNVPWSRPQEWENNRMPQVGG